MALRYLSSIHKAVRQIGIHFEVPCSALGVSTAEGHLLSYLEGFAPCPISEILRVFGHKPSTMTSMLGRLERAGLVSRETDPEDRRSVRVSLTRNGSAVAGRLNRIVRDLEARIGARVGTRDLKGFRAVMAAVETATGVQVRKERAR
jgi:DNA-binding MarR family transcriptional regulator